MTESSGSAAALAEQFRRHFDHRDHLYAVLLAELADDLEAGGPTVEVFRDRLDAPRADAVHLRLLAALFRIVLRGDAPDLERCYPVLGGHGDPEEAWPLVRALLAERTVELRDALDRPPQTNEVGRSACLAVALFEVVRRHGLRRVRLLEPGASAGLNLHVDRFRHLGPDWAWGPPDSPLVLDTGAAGMRPEELEIVDRRGCDLDPVEPSTAEGSAWLTSFVWPFDLARHARLAAALEVARAHPTTVDRASASTWVRERLTEPVADDVVTVVWQSITRQYWPEEESAAVDAAIEQAGTRIPVSHVSMEGVPPTQGSGGYEVARHGPELRVDGHLIARSHHHGPPVVPVAASSPPA